MDDTKRYTFEGRTMTGAEWRREFVADARAAAVAAVLAAAVWYVLGWAFFPELVTL